jgi:hypothetical protein
MNPVNLCYCNTSVTPNVFQFIGPSNDVRKFDSNSNSKGLSTRVRICVRIAIQLRARFVRKQNRDPILCLSPITIVCLDISAKKYQNLTCWTPLAANRTPNRRQPLNLQEADM